MKTRLWIYTKTVSQSKNHYNHEQLLDITIEPFGVNQVGNYYLAPGLTIRASDNEPPSLIFADNNVAVIKLPEKTTMTLQRNGTYVEPPTDTIAFHNLTVKDHLEITLEYDGVVETIHAIVIDISP